jgi:hypothetical protein
MSERTLLADERAAKAERALATVEAFVKAQHISCAEAVCQSDNVISNAYEFIEQLCEIAGYYEDET